MNYNEFKKKNYRKVVQMSNICAGLNYKDIDVMSDSSNKQCSNVQLFKQTN